jgi:hypothetical protein
MSAKHVPWVWALLLACVVALLSGCGGSMDEDDAVQPHFCHANPKACV